MAAFPFSVDQVLIAIVAMFFGVVSFYFFQRIFIPRYNINQMKWVRNLYGQVTSFKQTLNTSTGNTDGTDGQGGTQEQDTAS